MPFLPVDINAPLFTNVKDVSRETLAELRRDVLKDLSGTTYQRPALVPFATGFGPGGCRGNYYWEDKDLAYTIFNRSLYQVTQAGVVTLIASSVDLFEDNQRQVIIREGSQPTRKLYMANGGRIIEFDGTTAQFIVDADAPLKVTHIAVLDTYLIANDLSDPEKMKYSEVGNPSEWFGESISAEGDPDRLNAIHVAFREIGLFGTSVLESWYNDGVSPFSRIDGAMVEVGTLSPYSIVKADNGYFLLDKSKQIVRIIGRQRIVESQPINNLLGAVADVSEAQGERITQNGVALYTIRVGDRTFVFDYSVKEWVSEWGRYNKRTGQYDRFQGQHFINIEQWGVTLCGDFEGSTLYKLDFDSTLDVGDILRPSWLTGHVTHGTGNEKRSNALRIRLKRGEGTPGGDEPVLLVRWRDDGSKVWSNTRKIGLGFTGDDNMFKEICQLGSYRSRQYEFSCTEDVPIALAKVDEDVERLLN